MSTYSVPALALWLLLLLPAAASAGAWTQKAGHFWGKITYFQQQTDQWYIDVPEPKVLPDGSFTSFAAGTRRPYRFDGEYTSKAVFIEAVYGLTDRADIGVQLPFFDQKFNDTTQIDPPSDAGFSDMRLFVKFNLLQKPFLLTLKSGAKIPTGEFRNEDGLIPVGEGQWDYDFLVQIGRSFWPLPLYGNVDLGYRVRRINREIDRDPGDEWLLNAELGYSITRRLLLTGKFELLRSKEGRVFGFKNRSLIKEITYLAPSLLYQFSDQLALEAGVRYSINGRNFPAGHQLTLGLSGQLDLWDMARRLR